MSPPARRRSARLASGKSVKPAATPQLDSLTEHDEPPREPEEQVEAAQTQKHTVDTISTSPPKPTTPAASSPIKLAMSEMHPSRFHPTTAAPSSGLKLGFVDINRDQNKPGNPHATPSKAPTAPSSTFTFRTPRPNSQSDPRPNLDFSPKTRAMLDKMHDDVTNLTANLSASREKQEQEQADEQQDKSDAPAETDGRKIAQPKSVMKLNRFEHIHDRLFAKQSIVDERTMKLYAAKAAKAAAATEALEAAKARVRPSPSKASPKESTPVSRGVKRSQSKANLNEPDTGSRKAAKAVSARPVTRFIDHGVHGSEGPSKRVRQRIEDDASTLRPVSRDGSFIARPKSSGNDSTRSAIPRSKTLANLMTPTKASAARAIVTKTPTTSLAKSPSKSGFGFLAKTPSKTGLVRSPSKPDIGSSVAPQSTLEGLKKSATFAELSAGSSFPTLVQTPGRFARVKSILKRQFSASKPKSSLPTKSPSRAEQQTISEGLATPVRKLDKHVDFTPDTKLVATMQNSPSPVKSSIPRSKTNLKLPAPKLQSLSTGQSAKKSLEVSYPDLSAYQSAEESQAEDDVDTGDSKPSSPSLPSLPALPESVPGSFTFRSDHTIRFNSASPNGFGGAVGQASLRHVRNSVAPTSRMPGSFPSVSLSDSSTNKENKEPIFKYGIPHGMSNKKRHRAVWEDEEVKEGIPHGISNKKRHRVSSDDEDEDESKKPAAKKLRKTKNTFGEGQTLVAARLAKSSPLKKPSPAKKSSGPSRTPSPQKKGISLSRLNMLALPKNRK